MKFQDRLQKAIDRGHRSRDERQREQAAEALSEEECKRLHSQYRLELTEHIEKVLHQLSDQFPGFQLETVMGDRGWGAAVVRDDVNLGRRNERDNLYSRLELVVRRYGPHQVLDLAAKGTARNKEIFKRNHFQGLSEVDLDGFHELVDLWVLQYAEQYAAME